MTFTYDNVYVKDTATIAGPYEKKGPLKKYFDKTFDDLYFDENSWEKAEIKTVKESLKLLHKKVGLKRKEVDVILGGDLLNQITATTYGSYNFSKCFLGLYTACATSTEAMILGSCLIDSKKVKNAIVTPKEVILTDLASGLKQNTEVLDMNFTHTDIIETLAARFNPFANYKIIHIYQYQLPFFLDYSLLFLYQFQKYYRILLSLLKLIKYHL